MAKLLKKEDIKYDNCNFWWYYLNATSRGYDDVKELNINDILDELVAQEKYLPDFDKWYDNFIPESEADSDGYLKDPYVIAGKLSDDIEFAIEFHQCETTYYINGLYVGNMGGHFEGWFLTLDELIAFGRYEALLMLLLPVTGIEEKQREEAVRLISNKLKEFAMYADHAEYLARCMVNGLVIDGEFTVTADGITNNQNHSIRNIIRYPHYKDNVKELNIALDNFVKLNTLS